ncbi:MAG TPA: bifunctional [glutamine synthetase] adenylyltransferase/[glutamine synthetase]-adenylyl-L-tyrosine phosphorylase, partial [Acidimicrobiales bacterium]|nr:bifunctional [glutamine synthetase] adenylyltransferase/[glutamine synthetase]-adenylyl-L-tyrosine phosphorylase [Acidimicrobiales bacterium]
EPGLAATFAAVAAASRSLSRVIVTDPAALDVLARSSAATPGEAGWDPAEAADGDDLVRRKRLSLLEVAARDLTGLTDLEQVTGSLSEVADRVLAGAVRLAGATDCLAVIGMGKHGARELNYSSDVDVLLVASEGTEVDPSLARSLLAIASRAYRIDTNLRPEGRSGVLVRSVDSYVAYWSRWARPWEFQALIKARHSAGDAAAGRLFVEAAAQQLWSRRFGADDLAELRTMKARAEAIVASRGLDHRELKRGRGGIRDVEFSVQLLQLVHGGRDPALRLSGTLPCLAELADAGYVAAQDAAALAIAYRFLRTVEHRLQLVEEAQVHTVPSDRESRDRLARVLGFRGRPEETPGDRFDVVLAHHQSAGRAIHERLFFRPLLEAFAGKTIQRAGNAEQAATGHAFASEAADERLAAFGFNEVHRTRQALSELTRGLTRSSRLMQQLLPLLLDWLSESPDPDQGLVGLRTLAGRPHQRDLLVTAFRESPELARRLCLLLGTSRRLGEIIARHPDFVILLDDDRALAPPSAAELVDNAVIAADQAPERRTGALRHFFEIETVRIAARDLLGLSGLRETGRALADLGGAIVAAALHAVAPGVPMAVVAMGSFGGAEIAYGSDLDVLLVYEGTTTSDVKAAEQAASALFRLCNGATPAEGIVRIDASLRPEGKHGPLARSLDAFEEYHRRWGETWERQALLRARPVAGSEAVSERFVELAEQAVWSAPLDEAAEREIRRMKARIERERIPPSDDPQFHLKLGRGSLADVEWTVQLLQLRTGTRGATTRDALDRLERAGTLSASDAASLREAYRFCGNTRNRWHLVGNYLAGAGGVVGSGSDALPRQPELQSRLARSLGTTPAELRESYRRVTRRSRKVVERVFYGL